MNTEETHDAEDMIGAQVLDQSTNKNRPPVAIETPTAQPKKGRNAVRTVQLTFDATITAHRLGGDFKSLFLMSAADPTAITVSIDGATFSPLRLGVTLTCPAGCQVWVGSTVAQTALFEFSLGEVTLADNRTTALGVPINASSSGESAIVAATANQSVVAAVNRYTNGSAVAQIRIKATVAGVFTVRVRDTTVPVDVETLAIITLAVGEVWSLPSLSPVYLALLAGKNIALTVSTDATAAGSASGQLQQFP